jgi:hypothetical protein
MDIKPRPHRRVYLEILRRMTPAQRLEKSFELTEFSRQLLKDGLRNRHPPTISLQAAPISKQ